LIKSRIPILAAAELEASPSTAAAGCHGSAGAAPIDPRPTAIKTNKPFISVYMSIFRALTIPGRNAQYR
jgi:hypothetical protein